MNIWHSFKKPIYILAPMEDVTDTVFRRIITSCGRPDLYFTEFTNVEGMMSKGDAIVSQRLKFFPEEKPLIAQLWGKEPEHYYQAAQRLKALHFDGIDINMGCPQKPIVKNGCCAALIKNKTLASEIIDATQRGAAGLPVSVKTRIGYETILTEEWIGFLLSHNLEALTVHGRTAQEMSLVPAHWDEIGKVVQLRNTMKKDTLIIGNGDINSHDDAEEKISKYKVDGVMIGRGIFHDPYIFSHTEKWSDKTLNDRLMLLERHINLFQDTWGKNKHFPILKKYVKIYISDFEHAGEIRERCMETHDYHELLNLIHSIKLDSQK